MEKIFTKNNCHKIIITEQEIQDSFNERTKNKKVCEFDYNQVLLNDSPEIGKIKKNWKNLTY